MPLYMKDDMTKVKNYRPIIVFSTVSSFLSGYRKRFIGQTALFWLIEKWSTSFIKTVLQVQFQ